MRFATLTCLRGTVVVVGSNTLVAAGIVDAQAAQWNTALATAGRIIEVLCVIALLTLVANQEVVDAASIADVLTGADVTVR